MGKVWDTLAPRNLELGPLAAPAAAGESSPWRNWKLARDDDGIAWLALDKAGASANTLSVDVLSELDQVLATLEKNVPKGLVLRSAKPSGFIAGADIGEFRGLTDAAMVEERLREAHAVVDRLDHLGAPTVAVIHGYCLGGGLEIALACDYRIAVEDARLGFPEVMLGLHPGLGGTVRLPRLINPLEAMTMMLTGRNVRDRRARALGLVDAVVPERHIKAAATAAVTENLKLRRSRVLVSLINSHYARALASKRMRRETEKKAPIAHYPAPHALIDLWEKHGGNPHEMQRAEIASFARLLVTETSRNLVRVFFLRDKLKRLADGDWSPRHVHVIGAGAMGGDIAAWCAWHGFTVTLADMKSEPIAQAIARAADLFKKIGHKSIDTRDALDRLTPDLDGAGVRSADLVIEAVPESLELKRKVYTAIQSKMKPDAILATNTSSIPLQELRFGLRRPDHLVGLHFFNPVSRMQLVEVVSYEELAPDALAKARAFVGRIDRLPAPVKSAPGFLVNRALTPYMLEALLMLNEGYKRETIDAAAETFGMPMGPIELADTVGLDICLHVAETLQSALERPMPDVSQALRGKVELDHLGRKTGRGFYEWRYGKAMKERDAPKPTEEMTDRLILPMLDVAVGCLREGVVADEDTLDGAMIFATGFAPFRGGPMHYARTRGAANIRAALERLAQRYGERFRPDAGWDRLT
ncbi:MAG TPA: 3-hydroxyacyl-CoA dehydrogenase NAD-binding domain-containing protein [Xanthobacteraceae bacterium]|nr:3-hydroxyacyl-CoA dehydrogenase NAD-binding domain-containing protein [Xanthobacteraceae bacterium]